MELFTLQSDQVLAGCLEYLKIKRIKYLILYIIECHIVKLMASLAFIHVTLCARYFATLVLCKQLWFFLCSTPLYMYSIQRLVKLHFQFMKRHMYDEWRYPSKGIHSSCCSYIHSWVLTKRVFLSCALFQSANSSGLGRLPHT